MANGLFRVAAYAMEWGQLGFSPISLPKTFLVQPLGGVAWTLGVAPMLHSEFVSLQLAQQLGYFARRFLSGVRRNRMPLGSGEFSRVTNLK